jgi:hypothetical protein
LPFIPSPVLHAYSSERHVYEDSTFWSPSWGIGTGVLWTSNASDMITLFKALGTSRLVSRSSFRQMIAPLSNGLPGAPTPTAYGLGMVTIKGWLFQNPVINGYTGIAAYLPAQRIAIVIESTLGPNATVESVATRVFKALTDYLSPNNAI